MRILGLFIFCIFFQSYSDALLSGNLKGVYRKDKYLITGSIFVQPGDSLIVEAGSELWFQPMTGIQVKGVFIINGTKENAVVCGSSKNASNASQNAALYNWGGIRVMDTNAVLKLSYTLLCDAGTAINVQCQARKIEFDHVVFHKNGFLNIMRQGKPLGLMDDAQYLYVGTGREMQFPEDSIQTARNNDGTIGRSTSTVHLSIPIRLTFSFMALAGAGLWLNGNVNAQKYDNDYHKQKSTVGAMSMRQKRDEMVSVENLGMALCGIGAGLFSITFLF
ncbi:MAG TPA: hypothetical protein VF335_05095 [Chitinivibrionales bacterium]